MKYYSAVGFNWPYFSYGIKKDFVLVFNAFNPSFVQSYEVPENVTVIVDTFLTDTHDMYIIAESEDDYFEIYHVDLDS